MTGAGGSGSRRYTFPPLWAVPLLLIVGIGVIVYFGTLFGALGLVAAVYAIWWLQARADAYVRARDAEDT